MSTERISRLPHLILMLFIFGIVSLGLAAFLMIQQNDERPADEQSLLAASQQETQEQIARVTPTVLPTATVPPRKMTIAIEDGAGQRILETAATTVAEVLVENGIQLEAADTIEPSPGTSLEQDMVIRITRAIPLTIEADGQSVSIVTTSTDPLQVLAEAEIVLGDSDVIVPTADTVLKAGDKIQVKRVSEDFRFEDEELPFQTVYQPTEDLDLDTKAVLSNGVPGIKRRSFRLIFEDGVQVGEEFEEEWVEQEPINKVIGYGTRINTGTVDTPEGPREYWRVVRMRVTAYTAASSGKSPEHPSYGITASGLPAGKGIVAVDPNVIPFRSEVFVPGYGIGFAGDTGGGIKGRWIDLGYDEDELETWNGYVDVYYLTPIPSAISYLLPEVLP